MVHASDDHGLLRQYRRGAPIPIHVFGAEGSHNVGLPAHLALEIQGGQCSAVEESKDADTIGDRRRVAAGTQLTLAWFLVTECRLPESLAIPVKSQCRVLTINWGGEENSPIPDHRRGAALAG